MNSIVKYLQKSYIYGAGYLTFGEEYNFCHIIHVKLMTHRDNFIDEGSGRLTVVDIFARGQIIPLQVGRSIILSLQMMT